MSTTHQALINQFYTAFQQGDAETMAACYHDAVEFKDPAFGKLTGEEARNMWRMLISMGGEIQISFSDVTANETEGTAKWEAQYVFSRTGRHVHNKIKAKFQFQDGKIIQHHDSFSFWNWASMALGPMGRLLGFTPLVKGKVRKTSLAMLKKFSEKRK